MKSVFYIVLLDVEAPYHEPPCIQYSQIFPEMDTARCALVVKPSTQVP
jgi:hypothetical protein